MSVPAVKSWINVDPRKESDLRRVRDFVPPEDLTRVFDALEGFKAASRYRLVVALLDNDEVRVYREGAFDPPTAGSPSEVHIFEFDGNWEALERWSSEISAESSPYAFEGLEVGDLVMCRGRGFEIFNPSGKGQDVKGQDVKAGPAPVDRTALKLQVLSLALTSTHYSSGDHKKSTVEYANDLYSWVLES